MRSPPSKRCGTSTTRTFTGVAASSFASGMARRAYIEGSRTPVYDEGEPASETHTLHWEFDVCLIVDEPYHSLTPLPALPPVSWQEAPERLNEFLKLLASPA